MGSSILPPNIMWYDRYDEESPPPEESIEYNPHLPSKSNGYHHSKEITLYYKHLSIKQALFDKKAQITIANPLDYMGRYASSTIEWRNV